MYRSKEEVQRDLAEYETPLGYTVVEAWAMYLDKHRDLRGQYIESLVPPVLIHNYMEVVARSTLSDLPGITMPVIGTQPFFIRINNKYVIKPRLLYSNNTVATNATTLGLSFEDQPEQLPLPGMPEEVTHLHLGYKRNKTKTGYLSIHIACPGGVGLAAWEWTLSTAAIAARPIPFPVQPPSDAAPLVRPRKPTPLPEELSTEEEAQDGTDA